MIETFKQINGLEIKEGALYLSIVGDLIKITKINKHQNQLVCFNVSESCTSYHRIDSAIKDNKFVSKKY
jgi:hypothetical protein